MNAFAPHIRRTWPLLGAVLLILLGSSRAATAADGAASAARRLIESDRILVIAHRGDSKAAPENTLPAFQSAVDVGSDLVELDYVHTKDGVPLVIHDETLDRTTDARQLWGGEKILVCSKTLSELEPLDAGFWFGEKFRGTRLPTLEQSLDVIQNGSVTLIERKQGDPQTCVDLLRRKEMTDQVVVQAFDWAFLAGVHELAPEIALGALGFDELTEQKIATIKRTGAQVVGWQAKHLTPEGIARLHEEGYRVWAWTVDDVKRAEQLAEAGVDGIITNIPAKVKALNLSRPMATAVGQ